MHRAGRPTLNRRSHCSPRTLKRSLAPEWAFSRPRRLKSFVIVSSTRNNSLNDNTRIRRQVREHKCLEAFRQSVPRPRARWVRLASGIGRVGGSTRVWRWPQNGDHGDTANGQKWSIDRWPVLVVPCPGIQSSDIFEECQVFRAGCNVENGTGTTIK